MVSQRQSQKQIANKNRENNRENYYIPVLYMSHLYSLDERRPPFVEYAARRVAGSLQEVSLSTSEVQHIYREIRSAARGRRTCETFLVRRVQFADPTLA